MKKSASQPAKAPKQQQLQASRSTAPVTKYENTKSKDVKAPAVKKSEETKEDERLSSDQARSDLSAFFTHIQKSHSDSERHEHVEVKKAPAVKGLSESTKVRLK